MNIRINGNAVDVELQEEKTAWDVVRQLDSWLQDRGFAMLELRLDGARAERGDESWHDRLISAIGDVDIDAASMKQLRLAHLEILESYAAGFSAALKALSEGQTSQAAIKDFVNSFADVRPALRYLENNLESPATGSGQLAQGLDEIIARVYRDDGSLSAESLRALAGILDSLEILARDRRKEIEDPIREAQTTGLILLGMKSELTMVSTQILTGKAKEAFDTVLRFSELMSKLLRLFWLMVESQAPEEIPPYSRSDLKDWAKSINATLTEIGTALDSQDTVLLGDILEYELPQHIERLLGLIPGLVRKE